MSHVEACLSFPPISPTTGAASSAGAATPLAISAARCASPLQTCSRGVWNVGLIKARLAMCTLTHARAVAAGRQWEGFGSPRSSRVTGVAAAATVGHAERRRHRDREALHRQRGVRGRDYQQHRIRHCALNDLQAGDHYCCASDGRQPRLFRDGGGTREPIGRTGGQAW
ncbi:hypothetical protein GGX14DRAFT_385618 [Mycena pura]|uniref:Uncharacterized protein n=1 Tax=Mycena pura TaxID=153505 RepID=A0AAD7E3J6_9AGAR|nr:hypothetical protein GGX14DRAFT_385618 [Mycena pura]